MPSPRTCAAHVRSRGTSTHTLPPGRAGARPPRRGGPKAPSTEIPGLLSNRGSLVDSATHVSRPPARSASFARMTVSALRALPSVEKLLAREALAAGCRELPRALVVDAARETLNDAR